MRGSQAPALFVSQVRPTRAPFVLEWPERFIGMIRLLRENRRGELQQANKTRDEEVSCFHIHLINCKPAGGRSCVAMWKWSLVISFRQA